MSFLGLFASLIANASGLEQSMPRSIRSEAPPKQLSAPHQEIKVLPFVIEGFVESFDPVERANDLVESFSRKWCGTYSSFNDDSVFDVTLVFSNVTSTGQMVFLSGELSIDNRTINLRGNLNAKSNQMELLIDSDQVVAGLEPGGMFVGFERSKILAWKAPRLNNFGGILLLSKACT